MNPLLNYWNRFTVKKKITFVIDKQSLIESLLAFLQADATIPTARNRETFYRGKES